VFVDEDGGHADKTEGGYICRIAGFIVHPLEGLPCMLDG
jgi:hypothetical protein